MHTPLQNIRDISSLQRRCQICNGANFWSEIRGHYLCWNTWQLTHFNLDSKTHNFPKSRYNLRKWWGINDPSAKLTTVTWWRHQMETLLALCEGNSPVTGEFPSQRPVARSFGVFFDLRLNTRLSKPSRCRRFETPSRSLWRQSNDLMMFMVSTFQERWIWFLRFIGVLWWLGAGEEVNPYLPSFLHWHFSNNCPSAYEGNPKNVIKSITQNH